MNTKVALVGSFTDARKTKSHYWGEFARSLADVGRHRSILQLALSSRIAARIRGMASVDWERKQKEAQERAEASRKQEQEGLDLN